MLKKLVIKIKRYTLLLWLTCMTLFSCGNRQIQPEQYVYFNDFESTDYTGIIGVSISRFEDNLLMGFFNNDGFNLNLEDLPEHDFIRVKFDLYIHDSWEGNATDNDPLFIEQDLWTIAFDTAKDLKVSDKISLQTTFSNGFCIPSFCYTQSYPEPFPAFNDAQLSADRVSFGRCLWRDTPTGTSVYSFDKVFPHTERNTVISFYDELTENLCDESWSLDNLSVRVFKFN